MIQRKQTLFLLAAALLELSLTGRAHLLPGGLVTS